MKQTIGFFLIFVTICAVAQDKQAVDPLALLVIEEDSSDKELLSTLKTRRQMLNWHGYTAWAAVGLMGATLLTGPEDKHDSTHKWLGISSGVAYLSSASLAYFAPREKDSKQSENILIHKKLIWIHAPAMLLTVIAGIKAHSQHKNGEKLDTFAKLHAPFAAIAAVSFGVAALTSMDWTLNFIPTGKKEVACLFTKSF